MITELEIKMLDIDIENLRKKLESTGAFIIMNALLRSTIFYSVSNKDQEYIRVRDEDQKVTLTYKQICEGGLATIEHEVSVNSYEDAIAFLELIGLKKKRMDEKHRIRYKLDNAFIDIDTWPGIPTYVEIEANAEHDIHVVCGKLELDFERRFMGDTLDVFRHYGIDPNSANNLFFSPDQRQSLFPIDHRR